MSATRRGLVSFVLASAAAFHAVAAPMTHVDFQGALGAADPIDPVQQQPSKVHELTIERNKVYRIDVVSGEFDVLARLVAPSGKQAALDDDGGGKRNARIEHQAAESGVYKLIVTSFAGGGGRYSVSMRSSAPAVGKTPTGKSVLKEDGTLKPDDMADPVRGQPCKVHQTLFKKGTTYVVDMTSDAMDCYLRLVDESGTELAADDDSGGNYNARVFYKATKDGNVKIHATTFAGGEGAYTVSVRVALPPGLLELDTPTAKQPIVEKNELTQADPKDKVRRHACKTYTIRLNAGRQYTINLNSGWDNYLRLENESGQQLAADDDGGGNLNARIVFNCRQEGTYHIVATSFGGAIGPYTLNVSEQ